MTIDSVTVVWSLVVGALVAMAFIHGGLRLNPHDTRVHAAFTMLALGLAGVVTFELLMMRSQTPSEFGMFMRWLHIPGFVACIALVAFAHFYFRGERLWLAGVIGALRVVVDLVVNFSVEPNIHYTAITALRQIDFLGEKVSVAVGVPRSWSVLAAFSFLLIPVYIFDAARTCWRRGDPDSRRRAAVVGGGMATLLAVAAVNTVLINAGVYQSVYLHSLLALALMMIINHDLNYDVMRSLRLGKQLERSEAALRQSSRRLDLAVEAAGLGIWEWDMVRDEVWLSDEGRALFGVHAGERIDVPSLLGAVSPEDREHMRTTIDAAASKGESYHQECPVATAGGAMRWIATRGRVEVDAEGRPRLMRGVSFDVTPRREVEEQFQRLFEAAPVGILLVDGEGTIRLVNTQLQSAFGYGNDELVGKSVDLLLPEGMRAGHPSRRASYSKNPSTRPMASRDVIGLRKDGTTINVEVGLSSFDGPSGKILATVVDVSARKRSEEATLAERAFLRQVIDIVPTLIFAKDRDGRFTLANKAVAEIYGTTVEGLIGRFDSDFNSDAKQVAAFRKDDREVMDTRREKRIYEERVTDAAGHEHWLQTVKRPIVSEDGTTWQVLGCAADITGNRSADRELARLRNELAHLARVTMLSELSGSLAHELNQPLTAILSNAQAGLQFLSSPDPNLDEVREIFQDIATDDKRAGDVIKGLRLLLKRGEVRRERLMLDEVVLDVLRLVRSDMLNTGVTVTTDFAPGMPAVLGARAQLQQVLLNLVINACDSMAGEPAPRREIHIATMLDDQRRLRLVVSDRGRGIPAQDLERIFEPFYTTKEHGLGLGLSVCRTIVVAHGGRLWAENRAEGGAKFTITLPVGEDGMP